MWLDTITMVLLFARFACMAIGVQLVMRSTALLSSFGVATVFSVVLAPVVQARAYGASDSLLVSLSQECLLGLVLGAALSTLFTGIQFVGNFAMAAASTGDLSFDHAAPPLRRLLILMVILGMLQVGGDQIVVRELLRSLRDFPPGGRHVTAELGESLLRLLSYSFHVALVLACPLMATLVFANLCVGMISRSLDGSWLAVCGFAAPAVVLSVAAICLLGMAWWLPERVPLLWENFSFAATVD
jgi:flagellar biosynthetic protein FliR